MAKYLVEIDVAETELPSNVDNVKRFLAENLYDLTKMTNTTKLVVIVNNVWSMDDEIDLHLIKEVIKRFAELD